MFADGFDGVHDGGVVAAAEVAADFLEAVAGFLASEVHADLAREGDGFVAFFGLQIGEADVVVPDDGFDDLVNGDHAFGGGDDVAEGGAGEVHVVFSAVEHGVALDFGDGAFEFAGVGFHAAGDVGDDFVGESDAAEAGFFGDDGDAGFVAGFVDSGDEAGVEAGDEAVFEIGNFVGRGIGGEDDLLVGLEKGVEGVKEFLLGAVAAGEEVDVVDHEDIHVAVAEAELGHFAILHAFHEVVDEGVAGEVEDAGVGLAAEDVLAGGLQEVGFAEPAVAVDEEGVVGTARSFRDGGAGGGGEAVAGAGDEVVEDEIRGEDDVVVGIAEAGETAAGVGTGGEVDGDEFSGDGLDGFIEDIAALAHEVLLLNGRTGLDGQDSAGEFDRGEIAKPLAHPCRMES